MAQEINYAVGLLGFDSFFYVRYYFVPGFRGKTFFMGAVRTIDEVMDGNEQVGMAKIVEGRKRQAEVDGEEN